MSVGQFEEGEDKPTVDLADSLAAMAGSAREANASFANGLDSIRSLVEALQEMSDDPSLGMWRVGAGRWRPGGEEWTP